MLYMNKVLFDSLDPKEYIQDREKHAVIVWDYATYIMSWGKQEFAGPHVCVDDRYGVHLGEFFRTHKAIANKKDHYFKSVIVEAVQVNEPFKMVTMLHGVVESISEEVPAGSWVIKNPAGEMYYNTEESFNKYYRVA